MSSPEVHAFEDEVDMILVQFTDGHARLLLEAHCAICRHGGQERLRQFVQMILELGAFLSA